MIGRNSRQTKSCFCFLLSSCVMTEGEDGQAIAIQHWLLLPNGAKINKKDQLGHGILWNKQKHTVTGHSGDHGCYGKLQDSLSIVIDSMLLFFCLTLFLVYFRYSRGVLFVCLFVLCLWPWRWPWPSLPRRVQPTIVWCVSFGRLWDRPWAMSRTSGYDDYYPGQWYKWSKKMDIIQWIVTLKQPFFIIIYFIIFCYYYALLCRFIGTIELIVQWLLRPQFR